jgi:hypothetical protein
LLHGQVSYKLEGVLAFGASNDLIEGALGLLAESDGQHSKLLSGARLRSATPTCVHQSVMCDCVEPRLAWGRPSFIFGQGEERGSERLRCQVKREVRAPYSARKVSEQTPDVAPVHLRKRLSIGCCRQKKIAIVEMSEERPVR